MKFWFLFHTIILVQVNNLLLLPIHISDLKISISHDPQSIFKSKVYLKSISFNHIWAITSRMPSSNYMFYTCQWFNVIECNNLNKFFLKKKKYKFHITPSWIEYFKITILIFRNLKSLLFLFKNKKIIGLTHSFYFLNKNRSYLKFLKIRKVI